MQRAQQSKLAQDVNDELVDIRSTEVDYFVQFFTAFGTQAALIAGAQFVALAEIRTEDSDNSVGYSYVFWLFNALTIGLALHVLLCSVYIAVYGQGLALRGPIGSMVVAVEGMVAEQEQVVTAFTVMMCSLSLGTMGAFFVQMEFYGACGATVILACCMWLWYHYCLRIYNRFKFLPAHSRWDSRSRSASVNDRAANDAFRIGSNPMHRGAYNYTDDAGAGGSSGAAVDNVDVSRHSEVELRDETSITTETGAGDSFGGNSSNNAAMGSDSISMRNSFCQNTAPRASFTETMRSSISKMVGTGSAYTANNAGGPPPVALSRTSSYVPPKAGGSSVAGSSSTSGGSGGH